MTLQQHKERSQNFYKKDQVLHYTSSHRELLLLNRLKARKQNQRGKSVEEEERHVIDATESPLTITEQDGIYMQSIPSHDSTDPMKENSSGLPHIVKKALEDMFLSSSPSKQNSLNQLFALFEQGRDPSPLIMEPTLDEARMRHYIDMMKISVQMQQKVLHTLLRSYYPLTTLQHSTKAQNAKSLLVELDHVLRDRHDPGTASVLRAIRIALHSSIISQHAIHSLVKETTDQHLHLHHHTELRKSHEFQENNAAEVPLRSRPTKKADLTSIAGSPSRSTTLDSENSYTQIHGGDVFRAQNFPTSERHVANHEITSIHRTIPSPLNSSHRQRQSKRGQTYPPPAAPAFKFSLQDMASAELPSSKLKTKAHQGLVGRGVILHNGSIGTVRFAGQTLFASGMWLGVELDEPQGKGDGRVKGTRYFTCLKNVNRHPKLPYGIFVRETQIKQWEKDEA